MRRRPLLLLSLALAAWFGLPARPASAQSARTVRDVLLVLPVGAEQRHMFDLLGELRRGLSAGAQAAAQPRFRATATAEQLTGDRKVVTQLQRAGLHYGLSREDEQALGRSVRLPRKVGGLGGVLQASLAIAEGGAMQMDLELYEIGEAGPELRLRKLVRGRNLDEMRTRISAAGRVIAVQEDQGGRPAYAFALTPAATVRRGSAVTLDLGETADPELDAFDFAWCQAAGPAPARPELTPGRWWRGERQVRFAPNAEGSYTFLLWAGEVLRDEREPACEATSAHVAAIPLLVEPYALTLHATGAIDTFQTGVDRGGGGAVRLGANQLVIGNLGLRATLDLFERQGPTDAREGKNAFFGAGSLGPSYEVRLPHDLALRPFATLFGRLPPDGDPGELGWGVGTDFVVGLRGPWAALLSFETLTATYTRVRAGLGLAYRH